MRRAVGCSVLPRRIPGVVGDGTVVARSRECSDLPACLWDLEPQPPPFADWLAVRSRLTGLLLRMVDASHPPFSGWEGVAAKARQKRPHRLATERAAAAAALSPSGECPLREPAAAPAGWRPAAPHTRTLVSSGEER